MFGRNSLVAPRKPTVVWLVLVPVLLGILAGCQTVAPPKGSSSTLLVGKVIFKAVGVDPDSNPVAFNPNGIYKSPITLTLSNSGGSKTIELATFNNGLFISDTLAPGIYFLKKITVVYYPLYKWEYYITFGHEKQIVVKSGTVTNVGIIDWYLTSNPVDNKKLLGEVFSNRDYALVETEFLRFQDPQAWKDVPWTKAAIDQSYNN